MAGDALNDIIVRIRAEADGVASGIASAEAQLKGFQAATDASTASSGRFFSETESGSAKLIALNAAIQRMNTAQTAATAGFNASAVGASKSRAAYESLVIVHEALQGRLSRIPGSLMILAQATGYFSFTAIAATTAVIGFTAGLGYMAYQAEKARERLEALDLARAFAGKLDLAAQDIQTFTSELDTFASISEKDADAAAQSLLRVPNLSGPAFKALGDVLGEFADGSGVKLVKVTQDIVSIMNSENVTVKQLQQLFPNLTQTQANAAEAAAHVGDKNRLATVLVEAMADANMKNAAAVAHNDSSLFHSLGTFGRYVAAIMNFYGPEQAHNLLIEHNTDLLNKNQKALVDDLAALVALTQHKGAEGAQDVVGPIEKMRDQISLLDAGWTGSIAGRYAKEAALWKQLLAGDQLNAKERVEVDRDMNLAIAHEHSSAALEQRTLNRNVLREMTRDYTEFKETNAEDYRTDLELFKLNIDEKKRLLEEQVTEGKISKLDELAQLRSFTAQEYAEELKEAELEQALHADDIVAYNHYSDQIRLIRAQLAVALADIDRQIATANQAAARADVLDWKTAANEIMASEDRLVSGIFSSRTGLYQALGNMVQEFLIKEIEADLHYLTEHLIFTQAELAADKNAATGGWLIHLFSENQQTAATAAGVAARTSIKAAGALADKATDVSGARTGIVNDAYEAAAAAYKSVMVSFPPPANLIAAPIVAAGTFAAVMAYDVISSAEGGAWNTGSGGLYMLHPDESVLPANIANPMRDFFGGSGGSGGGDNYTINIHALDAGSVRELFMRNGSALVSALRNQQRIGSYSPSYRPQA